MKKTEIQYPRVVYHPNTGKVALEYPGPTLGWVLSPEDLSRLQREIAAARAQQISAEARRDRGTPSAWAARDLKQKFLRLVGGST